ncbi:MAG: hypothetical protein WB561_02255 [Terracidiphilus sp.]
MKNRLLPAGSGPDKPHHHGAVDEDEGPVTENLFHSLRRRGEREARSKAAAAPSFTKSRRLMPVFIDSIAPQTVRRSLMENLFFREILDGRLARDTGNS